MDRFGLDSSARASFAAYTTMEEIDFLADQVERVRGFFA
jgi:cysteine desulfurase/selenocysteine lyase